MGSLPRRAGKAIEILPACEAHPDHSSLSREKSYPRSQPAPVFLLGESHTPVHRCQPGAYTARTRRVDMFGTRLWQVFTTHKNSCCALLLTVVVSCRLGDTSNPKDR